VIFTKEYVTEKTLGLFANRDFRQYIMW
jgi:hypothetical protein